MRAVREPLRTCDINDRPGGGVRIDARDLASEAASGGEGGSAGSSRIQSFDDRSLGADKRETRVGERRSAVSIAILIWQQEVLAMRGGLPRRSTRHERFCQPVGIETAVNGNQHVRIVTERSAR